MNIRLPNTGNSDNNSIIFFIFEQQDGSALSIRACEHDSAKLFPERSGALHLSRRNDKPDNSGSARSLRNPERIAGHVLAESGRQAIKFLLKDFVKIFEKVFQHFCKDGLKKTLFSSY